MKRNRNKIVNSKPRLGGSMAGTGSELGDIITPDPSIREGAFDEGELEELYGTLLKQPKPEGA